MQSEHTENPGNEAGTPAVPDFTKSARDHAVFLKRDQLSSTPAVPAEELHPARGLSTHRFLALFRRVLPLQAILTLLAGVSWAMTGLTGFDWALGHITHRSVWFAFTLLALVLGSGCTLLLMVPARRTRQYRQYPTAPGETFCGLFAAAMLGIGALRDLYDLFTTPPVSAAAINTGTLARLAAAGMLLCALYFLCLGLGRRGYLTAGLAMGACLGVMLVLFRDYFDFSQPLNGPLRNFDMLAYASLLLFLVAETRTHVDLWYAGMPFTVLSCSALLLFCGCSGIGQMILAFAGRGSFSLIEQAAFTALAVLAFLRLYRLPNLIGDHLPPPPTEDEVKKMAKKQKK